MIRKGYSSKKVSRGTAELFYTIVRRIQCEGCGRDFSFLDAGIEAVHSVRAYRSALGELQEEAIQKAYDLIPQIPNKLSGQARCPHCYIHQKWMVRNARMKVMKKGAIIGFICGVVAAFMLAVREIMVDGRDNFNPVMIAVALGPILGAVLAILLHRRFASEPEGTVSLTDDEYDGFLAGCGSQEVAAYHWAKYVHAADMPANPHVYSLGFCDHTGAATVHHDPGGNPHLLDWGAYEDEVGDVDRHAPSLPTREFNPAVRQSLISKVRPAVIACVIAALGVVAGSVFFILRPSEEAREVQVVLADVTGHDIRKPSNDHLEKLVALGDVGIPELVRQSGRESTQEIRFYAQCALLRLGPAGRKAFFETVSQDNDSWLRCLLDGSRLLEHDPSALWSMYEDAPDSRRVMLFGYALENCAALGPVLAKPFLAVAVGSDDLKTVSLGLGNIVDHKFKNMGELVQPYLKRPEGEALFLPIRRYATRGYLLALSDEPKKMEAFLIEALSSPDSDPVRSAMDHLAELDYSTLIRKDDVNRALRTILARPHFSVGVPAVVMKLSSKDRRPFLPHLISRYNGHGMVAKIFQEELGSLDHASVVALATVKHRNTPRILGSKWVKLKPETGKAVVEEFMNVLRTTEVTSDASRLRGEYLDACFKLVNGMEDDPTQLKRKILDVVVPWIPTGNNHQPRRIARRVLMTWYTEQDLPTLVKMCVSGAWSRGHSESREAVDAVKKGRYNGKAALMGAKLYAGGNSNYRNLLFQIGPPAEEAILTELLKNTVVSVRCEGCNLLGYSAGTKACLDPLKALQKSDESEAVRNAASKALKTLATSARLK